MDSREPLPSGAIFQVTLRAAGNRDRATRGIRDFLLYDLHANRELKLTLVVCGVDAVVATKGCVGSGSQSISNSLHGALASPVRPGVRETPLGHSPGSSFIGGNAVGATSTDSRVTFI